MHITTTVILEPVHLHISSDLMNIFYIFRPIYMYCIFIYVYLIVAGGRRGRGRMVVGFSH
jgi:hypothetical protein